MIFLALSSPSFPFARCAEPGVDPEIFFPESKEEAKEKYPKAAAICGDCVHRKECDTWAKTNKEYGIWGGKNHLPLYRNSYRHMNASETTQERDEAIYDLMNKGHPTAYLADRFALSERTILRIKYDGKKAGIIHADK